MYIFPYQAETETAPRCSKVEVQSCLNPLQYDILSQVADDTSRIRRPTSEIFNHQLENLQ